MIETAHDFCGNERFQIRRRIGAGGMGVVYEAYDREHKMRVALKTLPQLNPSHLLRFKQEFRNVAGIVHPNLVAIYELFAVDGTWFFTMEFVEGRELLLYVLYGSEPIHQPMEEASPDDSTCQKPESARPVARTYPRSRRVTTAAQTARLRSSLRQLASAIDALHAAGKLHRDIKPSNVLVSNADRAVLLDFGLSIALRGDDHDRSDFVGTVEYMSPEQIAKERLTPASDWYAFGVMLYEALTGRVPFSGPLGQVMRDKCEHEPIPVELLAPNAPKDLASLCGDLLKRDPQQRPDAAEILELLGSTASTTSSFRGVPLIGREGELRSLRHAFDEVCSGHTVAIFVHGGSGEGKSFLIHRFLDGLRILNREADGSFQPGQGQRRDVMILSSRCYEAESVPYKALDGLVDELSRRLLQDPELAAQVVPRDALALIRLFPVLQQVPALANAPQRSGAQQSDQEVRRRATRAFRDLLANIGDRVALVVTIDDLQWGDVDSGIVLAEVLHGPDPPVLLLIGAYRSEYEERSAILHHLSRIDDASGAETHKLRVNVLSPEQARTLASALLCGVADVGPETLDAVAKESRGVPYFVHELARFLRAGAEISGGITLDQVIAHRLETLGQPCRILLDTIAVAGQPIRHCDAFETAHIRGEDRGSITLLRNEHLVQSSGSGETDFVEPYHDFIRETVVSLMRRHEKRRLHGALAMTLEGARSGDAETLAVHFAAAEENERAAHYYALAGRQASDALAFDRAAHLYRESLRLREPADPLRHDLDVRLADALANAGRGPEAARQYETAIRGANELEAIDLQRAAAYQYCVSGHIAEGRAAMRAVLGRYEMRMPESAGSIIATLLWNRFRLWWRGYDFRERPLSQIAPDELTRIDVVWSAAAGLSMNDIIAGAGLQTRGLLLALESGELYRVARSMAWEATHNSNDGSKGWSKTAKLLDLADQLAERSAHPHALAMSKLARGIAEFTMGRWATTVPLLDEADAMLRERCTGVAWELDTAHAFALWALTYKGDFPEMSVRVAALLNEAENRGDLYAATTFGVFHQPHALLAAGDPSSAREALESARSRWQSTGFYLQDLCALMTEALIDTYEGDGVRGFDRWTRDWKKVKASQLLRSQCIRALTLHFRARPALTAALRQGRTELLPLIESDARRLANENVAWCEPYAEVLFAGVDLVRGNRQRAIERYRRSADGFDQVNMYSHAASARLIAGQLTGGEEGARLASEAESWMHANGIREPRAMARLHIGAVT